MATFSIGDAAMSGVRIIREHPKAVLVWSLAYFVLVLSPQFIGLALLAPELMAGQELARSEDVAVATDLQGRTVLLQLIQIVTSLFWSAVFYGAVYRAVLEPDNSSRWYVRFGNQEFLVGAVSVVAGMLLGFMLCAIAVPFLVVFAFNTTMGHAMPIAGWIVVTVLGCVGLLVLFWITIRLSLAVPMSFEQRAFRLFESWALTRGHAANIFFANLVAAVLTTLFAAVVVAVLIALGLGGGVMASGLGRFDGSGPLAWPALLTAGAAISILTTVAYTLMAAPSAVIYRRLREPPAPAQAA
jgi:hypothetical protein